MNERTKQGDQERVVPGAVKNDCFIAEIGLFDAELAAIDSYELSKLCRLNKVSEESAASIRRRRRMLKNR